MSTYTRQAGARVLRLAERLQSATGFGAAAADSLLVIKTSEVHQATSAVHDSPVKHILNRDTMLHKV